MITKKFFQDKLCDTPGCLCGYDFYIHSACHPDSPTWTLFRDGKLLIECDECKKIVTEIAIKDE